MLLIEGWPTTTSSRMCSFTILQHSSSMMVRMKTFCWQLYNQTRPSQLRSSTKNGCNFINFKQSFIKQFARIKPLAMKDIQPTQFLILTASFFSSKARLALFAPGFVETLFVIATWSAFLCWSSVDKCTTNQTTIFARNLRVLVIILTEMLTNIVDITTEQRR